MTLVTLDRQRIQCYLKAFDKGPSAEELGWNILKEAPLVVTIGGKTCTNEECNALVAKYNGNEPEVYRYNGLGKINFETLEETIMTPLHHTVLKASIEEDKTSTTLMDNVKLRKRFIESM